jgi:hypothetical protein
MKSGRIAAAILVVGWGAMLALNAPGQLSYDSVEQLANGRDGYYNSWHPPAMAWLLGLFDRLLPGTALFLLFQTALLLAALLALVWLKPRAGWGSAAMALLIVLTPQWLLYQGEIWKDVLFADAAIAGFATLAVFAVRARLGWLLAAGFLFALAASVRQNGMVLLPVAAVTLALIVRRVGKSGWVYGLGFLLATVTLGTAANLALALRGDSGDGAAAQLRLGQSYDLAGALAHDPNLPLPQLAAGDKALEKVLRSRGPALWSPFHNDPFAADPVVNAALSDAPNRVIAAQWRELVQDHPLLYARVRLAVFARLLLTPDSRLCHFSSVGVEGPPALLHRLGLAHRSRLQDKGLATYVRGFFHTPVLSHVAWGALAVLLLVLLARRGAPADLAMAGLLAGALLFTLTFVIISIACDYRYLIFLDLAAMAAALHGIGPVANPPRPAADPVRSAGSGPGGRQRASCMGRHESRYWPLTRLAVTVFYF